MIGPEVGRIYKVDGATVMLVESDGPPSWFGIDADGDVADWYAKGEDDHRPLAVIDPDDREAVGRLVKSWFHALGTDTHVGAQDDAMQAALREFANPTPQPCSSALIIKGEHFDCTLLADHDGAHGSDKAGAIWGTP